MPATDTQKDAAYHCGIGWLLKAAYQRDFSPFEMGKCKTKFPTFDIWYNTLTIEQKQRVDIRLADHYRW